jgi:pimeloyl-ACP methyl ester carboxylesterase
MTAIIKKNLMTFMVVHAIVFPLMGQEIIYGSNNGKYVEVLGRDIYYEEYGKGEPILMLHGGPGSIAHFAKVIPALSKSYRVIAMDTPGQGHSERAEDVSYKLLAENASRFLDKLGIKKCYVIGFSDGACTSLLLAANRPDIVSKVFVSGGFSNIDGFTDEFKTFWSTITPEIVEQTWGGWHLRYSKKYPKNDWKTIISDLRDMVNDNTYITDEQLKSISSKVLLAYGDTDMFTMEHIVYLSKTIRDSELLILPGTSHMTFDEQPEMLTIAIQNFFKKSNDKPIDR